MVSFANKKCTNTATAADSYTQLYIYIYIFCQVPAKSVIFSHFYRKFGRKRRNLADFWILRRFSLDFAKIRLFLRKSEKNTLTMTAKQKSASWERCPRKTNPPPRVFVFPEIYPAAYRSEAEREAVNFDFS